MQLVYADDQQHGAQHRMHDCIHRHSTAQHSRARSLPEGVHVTGFMLASQSQLVAGAILADVLWVCLGQPLNGSIDGYHATLLPHALS